MYFKPKISIFNLMKYKKIPENINHVKIQIKLEFQTKINLNWM